MSAPGSSSSAEHRYTFRPASRADATLLRRWLATPEVRRWWGDPDEQFALLMDDLDEPRMTMRIVAFEDRPFAYAQDYDVHAWPQAHLADLPRGSRAIDAFIGEPDMIGLGRGQDFLRLLAERLRSEGAPLVVIDPAAENVRARRAYAKAGFAGGRIVDTDDGVAVVMTFHDPP